MEVFAHNFSSNRSVFNVFINFVLCIVVNVSPFSCSLRRSSSFFLTAASQEYETQMSYTSSNLTFFFCDIASHVFLLVHNSTCRCLISLPLSLTPVNCLSSWWRCSAHYYSSLRKVLGKCLSVGCIRPLTYKLVLFSKPLFRNGMSQNAKAIMRNTHYIPYALETHQIATYSEDPVPAVSSVHVIENLGSQICIAGCQI